jgi:hypothetical protein
MGDSVLSEHHHTHRSTSARRTRLRRRVRIAATLTGLSMGTTALVVGGGLLLQATPPASSEASLASVHQQQTSPSEAGRTAALADRAERLSRSADRAPVGDLAKARNLSNASGPAKTGTEDLSSADPRTLAKALMPQFGMSTSQFSCLDAIWSQESGWNVHAANPTSSAYGIPQALPGSKMSSAGPDWQNNPITQIKWGLGYIKGRYGSACSAAGFKSSHGWY